MTSTEMKDSGSTIAPSQVQTVTALPDVKSVHTTEELTQALTLMERRASDLVALDVVREGYMAHGHPASLGFQHLNTMTSSRLKKAFPLFDRTEPLFHILWAKGKLIVGEELVKKYEARKEGKTYDYTKAINSRFAKMYKELDEYREVLLNISFEEKKNG
jgi:hypothetical protein